jgi:replicative DNA helicase
MMDSVVRKHLDLLRDPDAERAVLAAIMFDQDKLQCTAEKLTIGDFAINANRKIFGAMLRMSKMNREISMCEVLVEMEMRGEVEAIGGPDYIGSLEHSKGYRADFDLGRCVGVIRRLSARRLFVQGCWELMSFASQHSDEFDFVENIWIRLRKLNDAIERLDSTHIPANN